MELDDTVCYCFHVSKRKILNYIRVHRPKRASQISHCAGAGTGCGWCVPYLERYFQQAQGAIPPESDTIQPEEYARQRAAYIKAGRGTPPESGETSPS